MPEGFQNVRGGGDGGDQQRVDGFAVLATRGAPGPAGRPGRHVQDPRGAQPRKLSHGRVSEIGFLMM